MVAAVSRAPLSSAEQLALVSRAKAGDLAARNCLIETTMGFVYARATRAAKGLRTSRIDADDLAGAAVFGVIRAIEKFDPAKGVLFLTYAGQWIRTTIQREVGRNLFDVSAPPNAALAHMRCRRIENDLVAQGVPRSDARRRAVSRAGNERTSVDVTSLFYMRAVPLDGPVGDTDDRTGAEVVPSGADVEAEAGSRETSAHVRRAMWRAGLSPSERTVIESRWLRGTEATLQEVGAEMSLSRERVRQIEASAFDKIRAVAAQT